MPQSQSRALPGHKRRNEEQIDKTNATYETKAKRKVQGVPQSQTAALPRQS